MSRARRQVRVRPVRLHAGHAHFAVQATPATPTRPHPADRILRPHPPACLSLTTPTHTALATPIEATPTSHLVTPCWPHPPANPTLATPLPAPHWPRPQGATPTRTHSVATPAHHPALLTSQDPRPTCEVGGDLTRQGDDPARLRGGKKRAEAEKVCRLEGHRVPTTEGDQVAYQCILR